MRWPWAQVKTTHVEQSLGVIAIRIQRPTWCCAKELKIDRATSKPLLNENLACTFFKFLALLGPVWVTFSIRRRV